MKYLLLLVVIAIGFWLLGKRLRGPDRPPPGSGTAKKRASQPPAAMVACAHCGLHLPAADAVREGAHLYCGEAHRLLGPRTDAT